MMGAMGVARLVLPPPSSPRGDANHALAGTARDRDPLVAASVAPMGICVAYERALSTAWVEAAERVEKAHAASDISITAA